MDGSRRDLVSFRETGEGTTEVPLRLYPGESAFIVFREASRGAGGELSVETINSLNVEYNDMEYVSDDMVRVNVNDAVYHVPEGCYFMMGDNRNDSLDARFWENTYVEKDAILGKVVLRYYKGFKIID